MECRQREVFIIWREAFRGWCDIRVLGAVTWFGTLGRVSTGSQTLGVSGVPLWLGRCARVLTWHRPSPGAGPRTRSADVSARTSASPHARAACRPPRRPPSGQTARAGGRRAGPRLGFQPPTVPGPHPLTPTQPCRTSPIITAPRGQCQL